MSSEKTTWRIATYNIHGGWGMDKVLDMERIANTLRTMQFDACVLCEVDQNCARSQFRDLAGEVGKLLNMNVIFAPAFRMTRDYDPAMGDEIGLYGIAIISPYKLTLKKAIKLTLPAQLEPRTAAFVEVAAETPFMMVGTHISWEPEMVAERIASLREIAAVAAQYSDKPLFLAGDLNDIPGSAVINTLDENWTVPALPATFPADAPTDAIDYAVAWKAQSMQALAIESPEEKVASDHRPLLVVWSK